MLYTTASFQCQSDEIGIHEGFKIPCPQGRAGSSPASGTTFIRGVSVQHFPLLTPRYFLSKL